MKVFGLVAALLLVGCSSAYETGLLQKQQWQELGEYHGEQGYQVLNELQLAEKGAFSETDYQRYRAGYTQGRFDYCSGRREIVTTINSDYPNDCAGGESYSLNDRGF